MKNDSNIVALNTLNSADYSIRTADPASDSAAAADTSARGGAYSTRLHRNMGAPLVKLQELSQRVLMNNLQDMFDKIDDALFELAEKASSNAEQNIFFESMREVRLKRVDIENQYAASLGDGFVQLFAGVDPADDLRSNTQKAAKVGQDSGLSLMADDTVEEMVAIEAMVTRAENRMMALLEPLMARISAAAGNSALVAINRTNNPLGPERLCHMFSNACLLLSIDIKARLVVFKLYEKHVVEQLGSLYSKANEQLIANNILPNYRSAQQQRRPLARTPGQHSSQKSAQEQHSDPSASHDYQYELQGLLQHLSHAGFAGSGLLSHPLAHAMQQFPVNNRPAVGQELLLQLLTAIQREPERLPGAGESWINGTGVLMPAELAQGIQLSLSHIAEGGDHSIGRSDRDVIALVGLLFQLVLEDRNLAEPMKAAISRLQIPVIKLAMQDAGFFAEKNHAARRLLNEMTSAATGWVAEDNYQNDKLYQCVCATIERVSNEFVDDAYIFSEVLADFISYVEQEKKRVSLREKRVVDAEAGRDQSESARGYVSGMIAERLQSACVPDFVRSLVENNWNNLLFLTYLKKGEQSVEWQESVTAMDDLLWTVADQRTQGDRSEIMRRIPAMLKVLRKGLNMINYDGYAAGEFFAHLEHLHMEVMQRATALSSASGSAPVQPAAATESPASTQAAQPVFDENNPFFAKAKMLAVGQWVELLDGDSKIRCRLVAILRNSGKRIFANRNGVKTAEYQVEDIATRLADESLVLLEDAQLFDKALSSIIDDLRQGRTASTA